jgi:ADP-ribose pyrophosphatase YjhB (NUDIX family)
MQPEQIVTAYDRSAVQESSGFTFCPKCAAPLTGSSASQERQSCPSCGWVYYRNPAPGVVILISRDSKVLLGRRGANSYAAGFWCLPGGFVEYDEDFLTAAIREVLEETGLHVDITAIISVVSNFHTPGLHTLVVVLTARIVGGKEQPGDDLEELAWYPLAGPFPEMAFEADRHIIERFWRTSLEGAPVDPRFARSSATVSR